MPLRILLVEDEQELAGAVQTVLQRQGHVVDHCIDGLEGWSLLCSDLARYELAIVDWMLPGLSGPDLCRRARTAGLELPLLLLTARAGTADRVQGLDAGADDYLGKPFELAEVEARLRALVRRSQGADDLVQMGRLQLERQARRVRVNGVELNLPAREYEVLAELLSPPGRTVSKKALSDKLSDLQDALADNALEAFISRLRKKLAGSGASIRTLRGLGYRVEEEPQA